MTTAERPTPDIREVDRAFSALLQRVGACRLCRDSLSGPPLPHEPRPVLRVSPTARLLICGQAPGIKVHRSGIPFSDRSGDRLRDWLGVTAEDFYDSARVAIVPMGFCFPGYDKRGSDLPPRRECAPAWRAQVLAHLPNVELLLAVGTYAIRWHLPERAGVPLGETLADWRTILAEARPGAPILPLPHPSWRNTGWLKAHPWFEAEVLPELKRRVRRLLRKRA